MPSNQNSDQAVGRLKLIHIIYVLVAAVLLAGISFGTIKNQQKVNTEQIKEKVDNDLFEMHQKQQTEQFDQIQDTMDKGFERLGKSIENIKG